MINMKKFSPETEEASGNPRSKIPEKEKTVAGQNTENVSDRLLADTSSSGKLGKKGEK